MDFQKACDLIEKYGVKEIYSLLGSKKDGPYYPQKSDITITSLSINGKIKRTISVEYHANLSLAEQFVLKTQGVSSSKGFIPIQEEQTKEILHSNNKITFICKNSEIHVLLNK